MSCCRLSLVRFGWFKCIFSALSFAVVWATFATIEEVITPHGDSKILIEEANHQLEVLDEPVVALRLLDTINDKLSSNGRRDQYLDFLLLKLRCYLQIDDLQNARTTYRLVHEHSGEELSWILEADRIVPESFVRKSVPWVAGSSKTFLINRLDSDSLVNLGFAAIVTEKREKLNSHSSEWQIRGLELSDDLWIYDVKMDFESLVVQSTGVNRILLTEQEKELLGEQFEFRESFTANAENDIGWLLRGMLLQQCPLNLGMERSLRLIDLSGGSSAESHIRVPSLELIRNQSSQKEQPCWVAMVREASSDREERFAFVSGASKELIQYKSGSLEAIKVNVEKAGKIEIADQHWFKFPLSNFKTETLSRSGLILYVNCHSGTRCFLGSMNSISVMDLSFENVRLFEFEGMQYEVSSILNADRTDGIGHRIVCPDTERLLLVFGDKNPDENGGFTQLNPYLQILIQDFKPRN